MIPILALLLAADLGLPEEDSGGGDDLREELRAREDDLLRTDARIARVTQELVDARTTRARAERAANEARRDLRARAASLYRLGHAARIELAIGGGPETPQAMVVLARSARDAAGRRRRAEDLVNRVAEDQTRLEGDLRSARAMRTALSQRTRELREMLGIPEPLPPADVVPEIAPVAVAQAEVAEAEVAAAPVVPAPVVVAASPSALERPPVGSDFVHPVWSTLPLLWVKRGAEAPILRYPTFDGAIVRASFRGRIAAIDRVRGQGRVVRIDHGGGLSTIATNFLRVTVHVGDEVVKGGILGRANGPVLFEMLDGTKNVDPRPWLDIPLTRQP